MKRSAIEHYEEILFGIALPPPKKNGTKKLPIFDDFATQWQLLGPISPVQNMI